MEAWELNGKGQTGFCRSCEHYFTILGNLEHIRARTLYVFVLWVRQWAYFTTICGFDPYPLTIALG